MKTLIETTYLWMASGNGKCIMAMDHLFFFSMVILAFAIGIAIGNLTKK